MLDKVTAQTTALEMLRWKIALPRGRKNRVRVPQLTNLEISRHRLEMKMHFEEAFGHLNLNSMSVRIQLNDTPRLVFFQTFEKSCSFVHRRHKNMTLNILPTIF